MDPLTAAHVEAKLRLQRLASQAAALAWDRLPSHDRANVDEFLSTALPLLHGANLQSVALTDAYLARALDTQPVGLDAEQIVAGIRNGTAPAEVYHRAFVTVWSALSDGKTLDEAIAMGRARVTTAAATDVQLAFRDTLPAFGASETRVMGYQRVADATACDFCRKLDGAQFRTPVPMALHPHCISGDTLVSAPRGSLRAVTRRWYAGQVVLIRTAAGDELTVTPNHPILTRHGWVTAGLLGEGDHIVGSRNGDGIHGRVPDEDDVPARIEDRFRAGRVSGAVPAVSVPFAAEQFHGDIGDGEVDVVAADGGLDADALIALLQPAEQHPLAVGLGRAALLPCECGASDRFLSRRSTTLRGMRGRNAALALRSGLLRGREPVLLGDRAAFHAGLGEVPVDDGSGHSVALRDGEHRVTRDIGSDSPGGKLDAAAAGQPEPAQFAGQARGADADAGRRLLRALSGQVQVDRITEFRRVGWQGHVYNLVTRGGWYIANGIVTHNCGCTVEPVEYTRGRSTFKPTPTPDGVAVHDHGELGPLIGAPGDHFAGPAVLA